MPGFRTEVPHGLGQEQATERLKNFIDVIRDKYKDQVSRVDGSWEENKMNFSLTTYGFKITGDLSVEDSVAVLDGQLPFAAVAFRGKIEQGIKDALEKALA
jgi:hypothetical protein